MIQQTAHAARLASIHCASLSTETKREALQAIARALLEHEPQIVEANKRDLERAEKDNIGQALLKRLKFDAEKLSGVVTGIEHLAKLEDPVGTTLDCTELDTGLELYRVTCPIGVLGIIFESRPDALVQISTLALFSGNAVLLKGGSEASETNRTLADVIIKASCQAGIPENWLGLLETREDVREMLNQDEYIDLIIPRGSNAFVKYIMENTRIMVLGHADGICHGYIHAEADMDMAIRVAFDSKCQYPAVCNAMETLLVDKQIAADFLPRIQKEYQNAGVELRGDEATCQIIDIAKATEEDWKTEYNDLILSIRIVDDFDQAIDHINTYGSKHTDVIVTENEQQARKFMALVDTANAFWNCSTRYADGFRYGLGAEVGISTHKVHARGPVGLEGLVTYKWMMKGQGHIVSDYAGPNAKPFTHNKLNKKY